MGILTDTYANAYASVKGIHIRGFLMQVISFATVIAHALIIWQSLVLVTGTQSPVVVVLSGSMEPIFKRGDIVFLRNSNAPIRNGEIVVYQLAGRDIPIIHRVISVRDQDGSGSNVEVLTKGDNNRMDDRLGEIYNNAIPGLMWLKKEHIIGRAVGFLPSAGYVTLLMQDYPMVKFIVLPSVCMLLLFLGCFE